MRNWNPLDLLRRGIGRPGYLECFHVFAVICHLFGVALAYATLGNGAVSSGLIMLLCFTPFLLGGCFLPAALRSTLRKRGYGWLTFYDCSTLHSVYRGRAGRMPSQAEIATVPGYTDSTKGLELVLNRVHRMYYGKSLDYIPELVEYWNRNRAAPHVISPSALLADVVGLSQVFLALAFAIPLISIPLVMIYVSTGLPIILGVYAALSVPPVLLIRMATNSMIRKHLRSLGYGELSRSDLVPLADRGGTIARMLPSLATMRTIMAPDWNPDAHELRLCIETLKVMKRMTGD